MAGSMDVLEAAAYVSFIVGAAFAVWQLYEMRRDRGTQLVLSMMDTVSSPDMQELVRPIEDGEYSDAREAEEKCGRVALFATAGYFEGLGYLVVRGMVDRRAVFEGMGIVDIWDKMKPWVLTEREKGAGRFLFENFEKAAEMEQAYFAKRKRKGV